MHIRPGYGEARVQTTGLTSTQTMCESHVFLVKTSIQCHSAKLLAVSRVARNFTEHQYFIKHYSSKSKT